METRRDVYQAIADPTRREIINLVALKTLNLNAIAENFKISRPAISQHVKILSECGLVVVRNEGRERFCEAKLERLSEVAEWVNKYRAFWTEKLNDLERLLDDTSKKTKRRKK